VLRRHPSIPHVWQLSADGRFGAPHIGAIGAIHGNELAGLRAIERVMADPDGLVHRMNGGTLTLIHGNPRATAEGTRTTQSGVDINRLFSYRFLDELPRAAWSYEHQRAAELEPLVRGLDGLIDLHSASRPTPPFAICDGTPRGIELARATGCHVTYGWDGPGMLMQHVSIGWMVAHGRPALSVECGQHHEAAAPERAFEVLKRFLGAVGLTDHPPAPEPHPVFELFARVVKPTLGFRLARDFCSFDVLGPGEELGSGDGVHITVAEEAVLLLPTPGAERGDDIVYLARRVG
jgi:predicted deacylase